MRRFVNRRGFKQVWQDELSAPLRSYVWILNLHLERFAFFHGLHEGGQQLGDQFQVFQAYHFHGRMHVAVRQADERAGDAAARPEDCVRVGAAGR